MAIKEFLKSIANDNLTLLENLNKCIINKDNSQTNLLINDLNGIISDLTPDKQNKAIQSLVESVGFFKSFGVVRELKAMQAKTESLYSRLSDPDIYLNTCKLGIKILEDNFQDQNDINTFNEKFDECQHYKDKYLAIYE